MPGFEYIVCFSNRLTWPKAQTLAAQAAAFGGAGGFSRFAPPVPK